MTKFINDIKLDETNEEFNQATEFVKNTDKNIYLTGKAGTGKTTFLKNIKSITDKNTIVLAPTGIAAINATGVTINSFFQIPFGPFVPNDKRLRTSKDFGDTDNTTIYSTFRYRSEKKAIIEAMEVLIIDEVSMVRCDTLDVIDRILKVFRKKTHLPFGGVQVILIGDVFQLPPIAGEWDILIKFYESKFFFSSRIMRELIENKNYVHFELKKIYRQTEIDFINLLNRIRINDVLDSDLMILDKKYDPIFSPKIEEDYIILSTHNFKVDQTNNTKLGQLKTDLITYSGEIQGEFPKDTTGNYVLPTELELKLKIGAQIMFLKNDSGEYKKYYNGKIGRIKSLKENEIIVEFDDETNVKVEKAEWYNIEYRWNSDEKRIDEKIKGTFTQYPLKLAWAITVHKSQGLTFSKVIADLGSAFEDGQVYVALSRCSNFNGLHLKTKITRNAINANSHAIEFAKNETPQTLVIQQLAEGKADFYYKKSRDAIRGSNFLLAFEYFLEAKKFRNDIELPIFKRYFIAYALRLNSYQRSYYFILKELLKSKENNSKLDLINKSQTSLIEEQNDSIKIISARIAEVESNSKDFKKQISESQLKHQQVTIDLSKSNLKIIEREKRIQQLEENIKAKDAEIYTLKNLKWHQRLLGIK
jgi:hypothetical protein